MTTQAWYLVSEVPKKLAKYEHRKPKLIMKNLEEIKKLMLEDSDPMYIYKAEVEEVDVISSKKRGFTAKRMKLVAQIYVDELFENPEDVAQVYADYDWINDPDQAVRHFRNPAKYLGLEEEKGPVEVERQIFESLDEDNVAEVLALIKNISPRCLLRAIQFDRRMVVHLPDNLWAEVVAVVNRKVNSA